MYRNIGKYEKARAYLEKSVALQKETGDRNGEASSYANLGTVYHSFGEYEKAGEYLEKSLAIYNEIGDRNGEASCHRNLAAVYQSVGEYIKKAIQNLKKSLVIHKELHD